MIVVTPWTEPTTSRMISPASPAWRAPACTFNCDSSISTLISLAACALRWASERTSPATTAKPLPGLAGPRRFHRRVQRQNIGLEGNAIDHPNNLGHLA